MRWVRNPWWDGFFLLSGLPIGIGLMLFVPSQHIWYMAAAIMLLETPHVVCPMIVAWSKPGLRRIVCREWGAHIVLPFLLMAGCIRLPWEHVLGVYFAWNIWHFGMQIFGVTCLYRRTRSATEHFWRAFGCVAFTAFSIGIFPFLGEGPRMHALSFGVFSFNHWLTDIGLSSRASGWAWGFLPLVFGIGMVWWGLRYGSQVAMVWEHFLPRIPALSAALRADILSERRVPQILAIRAWIGMVHFVYSARVWKADARAIIGRDLFKQPQLRLVA
jgi:hypothetical protein